MAQQGNQEQYNEQEKEDLSDTGGSNSDSGKSENGGQQSHNEEDKSPAQHVQSSWLTFYPRTSRAKSNGGSFAAGPVRAPYSGRRISRCGIDAGDSGNERRRPIQRYVYKIYRSTIL